MLIDEDLRYITAIDKGSLFEVKQLHENGVPLESRVLCFAVCKNSVEIMDYLVENGCEMDENVFTAAAAHSPLCVMEKLRACGCEPSAQGLRPCPWDRWTFRCTMGRSLEIIEWFHKTTVQTLRMTCLKQLREKRRWKSFFGCVKTATRGKAMKKSFPQQ